MCVHAGVSPRPHMYTHVYVWHAGVGPTPHYSCITRMLGLCAPGQDAYASRTCPGCALAPGHIHTNVRVCACIYINGAITAHFRYPTVPRTTWLIIMDESL